MPKWTDFPSKIHLAFCHSSLVKMLPTETEIDRNQRGAIMCALVITAHGKETQTDRQTDISDYSKNLVCISA